MRYATKSEVLVPKEKKTAIIEKEIAKLVKKNGTVTAQMLLEAATPTSSPLHDFFEWDDGVAALRYRIVQATNMIMATKFVVLISGPRNGRPPESFGSVPEVRALLPVFGRGQGFKMRNEVLNEQDSRAAFVDRKIQALRSWCKSVIDVKELDNIRATIERSLSSIT